MKKISLYALLLASLFSFLSCKTAFRTTSELEAFFNRQELKDINTIVSYYEDRIKKQTNLNQIDSAFQKFAKQAVFQQIPDFSGFDIQSLQQLYSDLNPKTYAQIWDENSGFSLITNDSIKTLTIAYEKKFMNYLKVVGKKKPKITFVHSKVEAKGSVDDFLLFTLYQDFDNDGTNARLSKKIGDFNNRFITAVFTITIAENMRRVKTRDERALKMQQTEKED
ncbi:MAG: hypothetical protein AAF611_17895 [Bacteroidota bacterium]